MKERLTLVLYSWRFGQEKLEAVPLAPTSTTKMMSGKNINNSVAFCGLCSFGTTFWDVRLDAAWELVVGGWLMLGISALDSVNKPIQPQLGFIENIWKHVKVENAKEKHLVVQTPSIKEVELSFSEHY